MGIEAAGIWCEELRAPACQRSVPMAPSAPRPTTARLAARPGRAWAGRAADAGADDCEAPALLLVLEDEDERTEESEEEALLEADDEAEEETADDDDDEDAGADADADDETAEEDTPAEEDALALAADEGWADDAPLLLAERTEAEIEALVEPVSVRIQTERAGSSASVAR